MDNKNILTGLPHLFCVAKKRNGEICGATAKIGPYCLRHVYQSECTTAPSTAGDNSAVRYGENMNAWFNELHQQALDKISGLWIRPYTFTDRPEVVRDLLEWGYIECRSVPGVNPLNTVCEYRRVTT